LPELFVKNPTAKHSVDDVHDTPPRLFDLDTAGAGGSWIDHSVPFHLSANGTSTAKPFWKRPTAVHSVDAVHDTPSKALDLALFGAEVSWIDHPAPFHISAKGSSFAELFAKCPTAVHKIDDVHDTPLSWLDLASFGAGGSWTDHAVPFHLSAKGTVFPELLPKYPTAVHKRDDVHDTPCSPLNSASFGSGGSWIDHSVPFHTSAKGSSFAELFAKYPAAVHLIDDAHDTLSRWLDLAPVGAGGSWIDHSVPFHLSAKGTGFPGLVANTPTAVQALDDVHDTPSRLLNSAPVTAGGFWADHSMPFHFSANGTSTFAGLVKNETPMHAVDDAHDTASRALNLELFGSGGSTADQNVVVKTSLAPAVVPLLFVANMRKS
jgi:hypothetical protein